MAHPPRTHRQLINSNSDRPLQSNHPLIPPIDHSNPNNTNPRTAPPRAKIREGKVADRFAGLHDPSRTEFCNLMVIAQVVIGNVEGRFGQSLRILCSRFADSVRPVPGSIKAFRAALMLLAAVQTTTKELIISAVVVLLINSVNSP